VSKGIIRTGIIADNKHLRDALILTFKKYTDRIDLVFDKTVSSLKLSPEEFVRKVKTNRLSALFISSEYPEAERIIRLLKDDAVVHTRVFLIAEGDDAEAIKELSGIADYTVFRDSDMFVVCLRVCTLCTHAFSEKWDDDRILLSVMAQELLRDTGFSILLYGYEYLSEAMVFCMYNDEYFDCLSALYYAVAHRMNAISEKTIEKSIRVALDKAYKSYLRELAERSGLEVGPRERGTKKIIDKASDAVCERLFNEGRPSIGKALPLLCEELLKRFEYRRRGRQKYENYGA